MFFQYRNNIHLKLNACKYVPHSACISNQEYIHEENNQNGEMKFQERNSNREKFRNSNDTYMVIDDLKWRKVVFPIGKKEKETKKRKKVKL